MSERVLSAIWNCWNCGKPGIPHTGSRYQCGECEVIWMPTPVATRELNDQIVYRGVVLETVDFTKPDALSSPA